MLYTTIADVLKRTVPPFDDHYLYIVRDRETVFYVGQSLDPVSRLHEHIYGSGRSHVSYLGQLIRRCAREADLFAVPSLEWQVEFLTLAECTPYVERYQRLPRWPVSWKEAISPPEGMTSYWHKQAINYAEGALIEHYRPCMNVAGNPNPTPLPECYRWQSTKNPYAAKLSARFGIRRKRR